MLAEEQRDYLTLLFLGSSCVKQNDQIICFTKRQNRERFFTILSGLSDISLPTLLLAEHNTTITTYNNSPRVWFTK